MSWPASPRTRMRPIGPGSPMRKRRRAALDLGRRRIGQIGPMAFAGVDDQHAVVARRRRARLAIGSTARAQLRDVVAERLAEAAGLEKVALHVDDDEAPWSTSRVRSAPAPQRCAQRRTLEFAMMRAPNERTPGTAEARPMPLCTMPLWTLSRNRIRRVFKSLSVKRADCSFPVRSFYDGQLLIR